jgi:hypothetical protein
MSNTPAGTAPAQSEWSSRDGAFHINWRLFLIIAAEARDRARAATAQDSNAVPTSDALTTIVFSAVATEAFINELTEAARRDSARPIGTLLATELALLNDLATILEQIEKSRGPIELKYHMASKILSGRTFERGADPFQRFANLVNLRNDIVHAGHGDQTSRDGYTRPSSTVIRDLQQKGLTTTPGRKPPEPPGGTSWIVEVSSSGVADWAYQAARGIVTAVSEMLPDDFRLLITAMIKQQAASLPN